MKKNKGLYVHIPFCNNICYYCDFAKFKFNEKDAHKYIDVLLSSIEDSELFSSIYIGGGSPSSLNYDDLDRLLFNLEKHLDTNGSFNIEVNPDDMDLNKIDLLVKHHINRVSIGVQTFNEKLLKLLNRKHTNLEVFSLIDELNNKGINDISIDLMFGLPSQTIEDLKNDLDIISKLKITHISTYALLVEDNTYFKVNNIEALDDDIQANMYEYINNYLSKIGFYRYEVSNFAKPSYESKHNLLYWHQEEYKGIGLGSSSYIDNYRYDISKSLTKYLNNDIKVINKTLIEGKDKMNEYCILNLRLVDGINLKEFKNKFNVDFINEYKDVINELINNNLCKLTSTNFYVLEENFFILNQILIKFI